MRSASPALCADCRVPLLLDGIISGHFNGQTAVAVKRECPSPSSPARCLPTEKAVPFIPGQPCQVQPARAAAASCEEGVE